MHQGSLNWQQKQNIQQNQNTQNPPPVFALYRWAVNNDENQQSNKKIGQNWQDEPLEVKVFFSSVYKSLKGSLNNQPIDFNILRQFWSKKNDFSISSIEEEMTSDLSLSISGVSSIHKIEDEQFLSPGQSFISADNNQLNKSAFLQQNTMEDIENFCKLMSRLSLDCKDLNSSFMSLSNIQKK